MTKPVYIINGFLESGKTEFITFTLGQPYFQIKGKTLLILCEEGENEYDPALLKKSRTDVVLIEEEEEFTPNHLIELEKQYKPARIIIEYNGMWMIEPLYRDSLPANWILYQIMCLVDARSFEMYVKNMGQLMMEKISNADMLIFNHCNEELRAQLRSRNLRMVNRRADIYLEDLNGNSEDYNNGEVCPFDLDQPVINIPDDDYGVWYVDVMDYPDRWAGKTVHMKLLMCHSKKYPGTHCPGRFAMVCCENDVQFLGLVAKGVDLNKYKNRDWVEVEARMALENHSAYKGKGPVMHIISIKPCEKPANEVVTF